MTQPAPQPAARDAGQSASLPKPGRHAAHGRRAFLAFLASAALRPGVVLAQGHAPMPVVLYTVGDAPSGLFRRSLRDALHGLDVTLTLEEADSVEAIRRPRGHAACLIVVQDESAAQVLRVDSDGSHHLLRRVPLRGHMDAAARAAIGHVVRSAVEAVVRLAPR